MKILDPLIAERLRNAVAAHESYPNDVEHPQENHTLSSICLWTDLRDIKDDLERRLGCGVYMPDQAYMSDTFWRILGGLLISAVSNFSNGSPPEAMTFSTYWALPKIRSTFALNLEDFSGLVKQSIASEDGGEDDTLVCEYHFELVYSQRLLMNVTSVDEVESLEGYPAYSNVKTKEVPLSLAFSSEALARARFLERMIKVSKNETIEHRISYTACVGMNLMNMLQQVSAVEEKLQQWLGASSLLYVLEPGSEGRTMIAYCDAARRTDGEYRGASGWAAVCYRSKRQAQNKHQRPYRILKECGFAGSSMEAELLALLLPLKLRRVDKQEPIILVTDCQSYIAPWENYLKTRDAKGSSPKGMGELWAEFCNKAGKIIDEGGAFKLEWELGHQGVEGPRRLVNIQARKLMRIQMKKADMRGLHLQVG